MKPLKESTFIDKIFDIYKRLEIKKNLILFGPPLSGKTTFSERIQKFLPYIVHLSTGDLLRENVKNNTPFRVKVKDFMDKGVLVPDGLVVELVRDRLNKKDVKNYGCILDGFPRNLKQCIELDRIIKIDLFLLLEVPRDLLMKRVLGRYSCQKCGTVYNKFTLPPRYENICDKCGDEIRFIQRSDDNEETFNKRMDVYEQNAKPIIEYYKKLNLLKIINAENTLSFTDDELKQILDVGDVRDYYIIYRSLL